MRRKDDSITTLVNFRVTQKERERLERMARDSERSVSQLLRLLVRNAEVRPGGDVVICEARQR